MENLCVLERKYFDIPLSVSIGIAFYPDDGVSLEKLYEKADAALYRAKKSGKNKYVVSLPERNDDIPASGEDDIKMTLREFYSSVGGDYQDVIERLHSEEIVIKFLIRFMEDTLIRKLEKAVSEGNQPEAFTIIHTFKGTCINMGLGNLSKLSSEMTEALRTQFSSEVPALLEKVMQEYTITIERIHAMQEEREKRGTHGRDD